MAPDFRRGAEAIEKSQEAAKSGGNRSFVPFINWREDKEEKYILFLNPLADVPTVSLHEWIEVGTRKNADGEKVPVYDSFISRKEFGEDYDDLEDRLDHQPKERNIAVAVELEPVFETVRGRKRPTSFTVLTDTYERRVDDEETEEVTQPMMGLVTQAISNFYGYVKSFDQDQAPIEETPFKVTRRGAKMNTQYDFVPFTEMDVDLSPLVEYFDGLSYLSDEADDIRDSIEKMEDTDAAMLIGKLLLEKRLDELADGDRYEELVSPIEELVDRFAGGKKKTTKSKGRDKASDNGSRRRSRPARKSQREAVQEEPSEEPEEVDETAGKAEKPSDKLERLRKQVEKTAKGK